ncbi:MAG: hypothetical protein LBK99_00560 [Opitutaceae bacterium]|nr:hypothetical protein [Opitutaceae bacterium]
MLAAITIPVVSRVRSSAADATCKSNLRQLYSALLLYAQDHKDCLPVAYDGGSISWVSELLDGNYLPRIRNDISGSSSDVLGCPVQRKSISPFNPSARTYSLNYHLQNSRTSPRTLASIDPPSRVLLSGDGAGPNAENPPFNIQFIAKTIYVPTPVHPDANGRINTLYADGHVSTLTSADIPGTGSSTPGTAAYQFWQGR